MSKKRMHSILFIVLVLSVLAPFLSGAMTVSRGLTPARISLTLSPNILCANRGAINCSVILNGTAPVGGTITWSTNSTTVSFLSGPQNSTAVANGFSSTNFTDTKSENVTITASYSGDSSNAANSQTANIMVRSFVDVNQDGLINFNDVVFFVNAYIAYYSNSSHPVAPTCDVNGDGVLNFLDLKLFIDGYVAGAASFA